MTKITVVAPYDKFANDFQKVYDSYHENLYFDNAERKYELDIKVIYNQDFLKTLQIDSDVIIARGFSSYLVRMKNSLIPVVEVPILPNDIIRTICKCKELYPGKQIVFPGTYAAIKQAQFLNVLLDNINLEIIEMNSTMGDEIKIAFEKIKSKNFVIIGGEPICEYAVKHNLPNILIETGYEAMYTAITEAKRTAYISQTEQEKNQIQNTIINSIPNGLVVLDTDGRVLQCNTFAINMFQLSNQQIVGTQFNKLFPSQKEFCDTCLGSNEFPETICNYQNNYLVIRKTGIFINNSLIGSYLTFQYASQLQEVESKVRTKIYKTPLIAKYHLFDILGESKVIREKIEMASRYAESDASILITGETGTGKELFAQGIHNASSRRDGPFVAINCAAIPESLLESELFGYEEGAFTGALKGGKPGLIELAHHGTLFLDEISELPTNLQGRLLRVLQEKEIRRLGASKPTIVDIRVISATNKNLATLVSQGQFRSDLYYRLVVLKLVLPSLEERKDDIPILAQNFILKFSKKMSKNPIILSNEMISALQSYPWNGNIRELENICECLMVLSKNGKLTNTTFHHILSEKISPEIPQDDTFFSSSPRGSITKEQVEELLKKKMSHANMARYLHINRTTLWRDLKKWNLL